MNAREFAETLNKLLSPYGQMPSVGESWEVASPKVVACIARLIPVVEAAKACREFSKAPSLSPMRQSEGEELLNKLEAALEELEKS